MVGSTGGTCDCGVPRTRFSTDSSVCSADGFDHYEHLCCNCLKRTLNWRYYDDDACAQCVSRKLQSMSAGWNPPLRLGDSATIPSMGYGVGTAWFKCDAERQPQLIASVQAALDAGYRHIDEAEMYANEAATGIALQQWLARNPSTPRSELFVTSKVISVDDGIEAVCRRSLAALGVSYFDLYLIHAPFQRHDGSAFQTPLPECWQQMEALVDAGLAKSIGVSNWRVADLAQIYDGARIKPSCNQTGKGILTTTSSPARLEEYKGAFSFELAHEQVESISLAGRSSPRRMFWTQCTPKFREDPREELTSCDGTDVHDHVGSSL